MTSKEALESLRQECKATFFDEKGKQWWTTDKKLDYRCNIIEKDLKVLEILKPMIKLEDSKTKNEPQIVGVAFIEAKGFVLKNSRAYELLKEWLEK